MTDTAPTPRIAVTMGDPAGIGPELCLRLLSRNDVLDRCVPVLFGNADVLHTVAARCGLSAPGSVVPAERWEDRPETDTPCVVDCGRVPAAQVRPGLVQTVCGREAHACVVAAVENALKGRVSAVVTAPLHKQALRKAGVPHPGHTEILAEMTGTGRYCMMMAAESMAVSLATTHIGLADVPRVLTTERILEVIELTAGAMRLCGIPHPVITVCGLNPHGGEEGLFGGEESALIAPAVATARDRGYAVQGPLPPDTAFLPAQRERTDAYVAMYHDQGLIPFKMLAFDTGVNITLGLPIVRTSVDHGTAFDIAWQGRASPESLIQAVLWAVRLCSPPAPRGGIAPPG